MKWNIEFPCGYKVNIETGLKDIFTVDIKADFNECPIHGKNCK